MSAKLLSILRWNLVATALCALLYVPFGEPMLALAGKRLLIAFVYSNCIGTLIGLTFDTVAFRSRFDRLRSPWNWAFLIASLAVLTVAGCSLAALTLAALGIFSIAWFWSSLQYSLLFSLGISLAFGVGGFLWDRTHAQLERSQLARERALKLAAEARLSSLESRIHPHFLFNTLNSIAALIREDPERAEETVGRLAALLRFSLDSDAHRTVPLGRELRVVEKYLEIERVRFRDRLRYAIDVPEELAALEVPPLALQTLVENSVKYAVSPRRAGAEIRIRARLEGERAAVEVEDDGPGFGERALVAGHGLASLRERLASLYGDRASLEIAARDGRTAVRLSLPCNQREAAAS
jgi:sensor histidine kinase YesM